MLSRAKFEINDLVNKMLDQFPESIWKSNSTRFLDPAIGGGQFVRAIEQRLRQWGHSDKNISKRVFGYESSNLFVRYAVNKYNLVGQYEQKTYDQFMELDSNMKFDVVIGNPPFHDGEKEGGQNKIYNMLCKKALSLVVDNGYACFVTPTSVLKKSKRFSLINLPGLKVVDFTADNYFDVGINICSWYCEKSYTSSNITVINHDNVETWQSSLNPIYDYSKVDREFTILYNSLKEVTDSPEKRMFRENNFGEAVSKSPKKSFAYVLHSVNKTGNKEIFGYSKRVPFFYQKKKIVIPMTKTLTDQSILIDTDDYYVAYLCAEVANDQEIKNIKSFILSEYFRQHAEKWRNLDGYGFNYALKYLPPFDTSRSWTNKDVKEFIESFA